MQLTTQWHYVQAYDEYYDFEKELISLDDKGDSSLDMRLTFNVETRTAYITLAWKNDDGKTAEVDGCRYVEWGAAVRLLQSEGILCEHYHEALAIHIPAYELRRHVWRNTLAKERSSRAAAVAAQLVT